MNKNAKSFGVVLVGAVTLILIVFAFVRRDVWLARHETFECGDGPRRTIDLRDFTTRYSAYSVELQATVGDKAAVTAKLEPVQQQQISEASQAAAEFRKYVVAGYDSCAITKAQYSEYGERLQALDGLAREINAFLERPTLSPQEHADLAKLISQYLEVARKLSAE